MPGILISMPTGISVIELPHASIFSLHPCMARKGLAEKRESSLSTISFSTLETTNLKLNTSELQIWVTLLSFTHLSQGLFFMERKNRERSINCLNVSRLLYTDGQGVSQCSSFNYSAPFYTPLISSQRPVLFPSKDVPAGLHGERNRLYAYNSLSWYQYCKMKVNRNKKMEIDLTKFFHWRGHVHHFDLF